MPAAIITGASSGIGRALALELARRGYDLGLSARRVDALTTLADEIRAIDAARRVVVKALDVQDVSAVRTTVRSSFEELGAVETVIANAGIGGKHGVGNGTLGRAIDIVTTNLIGGMATVDATVEWWREHPGPGPRRVVGITSVAGFRGLPGSSAYSASKAGFSVYLEAARGEAHALGVEVIDIAPGFIDTPINQDVPTRPFLVDATDGARRIADLIARGVSRSTVPVFPWNAIGFVMRSLPDLVWNRVSPGLHRGRS
jgi:short-subunit dehydrogenase